MNEPFDHCSATPPQDRTRKAKAYEAAHNRLFLLRLVLTVGLIGIYWWTGASAELADGLRMRFGDQWWWTNVVYLLVTLFAFSAVLFPLSWYSDYYLEHCYGLSHQHLNSWLADYAKSLVLELILTTLFVSVLYAFLRWTPHTWWMWATVVYTLLSVVLSALWPVWIMPLFHTFEPLEDSEISRAARAFAEASGLQVLGVYRWGLEDKTETANAALTGLGRTRRVILSDTMLDQYSKEEILAVLAHEIGHFKHRDMWRLMSLNTALAALGFYVAHRMLVGLTDALEFGGVDDIGAFPVFIFSLFLFSLIAMPLGNAYSRRREFAADAYAVRATGKAEPLTCALTRLADQNLADKEPSLWIELLLHSHPSISRRIKRIKAEADLFE